MKRKSFALALLAVGLLSSWGTASAITLRLDALSANTGLAAFDVLFDDTGDGLLQYEEIISTSGLLLDGTLFDHLLGVPTIAGISTVGGPCGPDPDAWCFVNFDLGFGVTVTTDEFTYSIGPVSVSEPASLSLLVIAFGILAARLGRTRNAR
jgi:hypothetical protein